MAERPESKFYEATAFARRADQLRIDSRLIRELYRGNTDHGHIAQVYADLYRAVTQQDKKRGRR